MPQNPRTPNKQRTTKPKQTTPGRSNSSSLDDKYSAQVVRDVNLFKGTSKADYRFIWRKAYKKAGLDREKVRKRFYYYRDFKIKASADEWNETLEWAKAFPDLTSEYE